MGINRLIRKEYEIKLVDKQSAITTKKNLFTVNLYIYYLYDYFIKWKQSIFLWHYYSALWSIFSSIRDSIVASIPACHAGDRGSIPRRGVLFLYYSYQWENEFSPFFFILKKNLLVGKTPSLDPQHEVVCSDDSPSGRKTVGIISSRRLDWSINQLEFQ